TYVVATAALDPLRSFEDSAARTRSRGLALPGLRHAISIISFVEQPRMITQADFQCRCGEVRGRLASASPGTVNRVICYCDDSQALAHLLGRADLLDVRGGSDIVQVAPASITFEQGQHRIAGLRLTPKGLFRWYARCCNTPVGNTISPAIPFVGISVQAFD